LNTNNTCPTTCPNGRWENSTNNNCDLCTPPCATCGISGTDCLSCNTGRNLIGNECLSNCPAGFWGN